MPPAEPASRTPGRTRISPTYPSLTPSEPADHQDRGSYHLPNGRLYRIVSEKNLQNPEFGRPIRHLLLNISDALEHHCIQET